MDTKLPSRKIVAVDIDHTITNGEPFYLKEPTPNQEMIEKVNELYRRRYVIIYHTGRHPSFYQQTYAWLVKHGCFFHALEMGKLSAEYYIDDKNINIDELLKCKHP